MLGDKNTNTTTDNTDEFIVHTMSKDLEEARNPSARPYAQTAPTPIEKTTEPTSPNRTPIKTTNPFLATEKNFGNSALAKPTDQARTMSMSRKTVPEKNPNPFEIAPNVSPEKTIRPQRINEEELLAKLPENSPKLVIAQDEKTTPSGFSNFFILSISLILLLVAGGGFFYFFYYKDTQIATETPIETPTPATPAIEVPATPIFTIDKPNYLPIDLANSDNGKIEELLKTYSIDVAKMNPITPIEFVATDPLNNPISFIDFSNAAGISLSAELLATLSDNFSLFIFMDRGNPKIGIAVDLKDSAKAKSSLKKEESSIITALTPLYLGLSYPAATVKFQDNAYKNFSIRYFNLISPTELSVDYMITADKLIVGTTRNTATAIFDSLAK